MFPTSKPPFDPPWIPRRWGFVTLRRSNREQQPRNLRKPATVGFQRRLMPTRTVFATSSDIGDHVNAPLAGPSATYRSVVLGLQRNLKTSVSIQERRLVAIERQVLPGNHEVGTRVPSWLVAKCCSIRRFEASKKSGASSVLPWFADTS